MCYSQRGGSTQTGYLFHASGTTVVYQRFVGDSQVEVYGKAEKSSI